MLAEKDATVLPTRDSAVSFLQSQHAKTLHGLHAEIQKLQKKCARLTFELTVGGRSPLENADTSEMEDQLKSSRDEIAGLRSLLTSQEEKIFLLEHEIECLLKEVERCNRVKDDMIRSLQHQLEEKSATIAHLVTKLHHTQKYLQKSLEAGNKPLPPPPPSLVPRPKEPPLSPSFRTGRITRRLRRSIASSIVADDTSTAPLLPSPFSSQATAQSHGNAVSRNNTVSRISDTVSRSGDTVSRGGDTVLRSKAPVLPPINDRPSHKRYVLAKSQGLTSAPCSLRLVDCKPRNKEGAMSECEEDISNSEDGKLLVKYESHVPLTQLHRHRTT